MMRVCLDELEKFSDGTAEKLINTLLQGVVLICSLLIIFLYMLLLLWLFHYILSS